MEKAALFKIKEGEKDKWFEWCRKLSTSLRNEAVASLEEEAVLQELTLTFELAGSQYVLGYMAGEMKPANMDREVNRMHLEMRNVCLEKVTEVDVLYNIHSQ